MVHKAFVYCCAVHPCDTQAANAVISHAKLCSAILGMRSERPCIFAPGPLEMEIASISCTIRVFLSKFRIIKREVRQRDIVRQKDCSHFKIPQVVTMSRSSFSFIIFSLLDIRTFGLTSCVCRDMVCCSVYGRRV